MAFTSLDEDEGDTNCVAVAIGLDVIVGVEVADGGVDVDNTDEELPERNTFDLSVNGKRPFLSTHDDSDVMAVESEEPETELDAV